MHAEVHALVSHALRAGQGGDSGRAAAGGTIYIVELDELGGFRFFFFSFPSSPYPLLLFFLFLLSTSILLSS